MCYLIQNVSYVINQEIREMCFRLTVDLALMSKSLYVLLQRYLSQRDPCPEANKLCKNNL